MGVIIYISKTSSVKIPLPPFSPQRKKEDQLQIRKVKNELLDNEILRAFGRAVTKTYRAASGRDALDMLLRSGVTKQVRFVVNSGVLVSCLGGHGGEGEHQRNLSNQGHPWGRRKYPDFRG